MLKHGFFRSNGNFVLTRGIPAVVLIVAIGIGVLGLLVWSGHQADRVSFNRQTRLVSLVVSQMRSEVAHDQESATVWDEAIRKVRANDQQWIDANLGSWMHSYFGIDGAYVLNPQDQPIYAFAGDTLSTPDAYAAIAPEVAPLLANLRQKLRDGDTSGLSDTVLSPGVSDLAIIRQHPAIVSVKPIVSDTGDITQAPGREYLHVAVRYLDGAFLTRLQNDYLFDKLRFAWHPSTDRSDSNEPLKTAAGTTIGYYVWHPYRPGSAVLSDLVPAFVAVLVLVLATVLGFLAVVHNRSQKLRASEERIRHMALHDPLTNLPNRVQFNQRADEALTTASRDAVALLYLDLDRFKQVNDTLGHPAGDVLIKEFGQRLRAIVRSEDVVARIGGDEFTVMLTGRTGRADIETVCERIVDSVRQPFEIEGNRVFVGVSIGVTVAPADGTERVDLLRKADVALYHSKSLGRGRFSFFSAEMDQSLSIRRDIEAGLRQALMTGDQFAIHYQPIHSAREQRVTGFEALLRWRRPRRGWMAPERFIPVAEETGLIDAIGQYVLREACAAAVNWPGMTIAVNVSGVELNNPSYAEEVAKVLGATGLDPHRLEIEITETTATEGSGPAAQNLQALRTLGVRTAIDDFGTGFSSLGRLQSLKVDRIKIDQSFVQGFGRTRDDEAVIQAIVDLAHAKGLKTTAEGVETPMQSEGLTRVGCDDLQGFLYSRAVPLAEVNRQFGIQTPSPQVRPPAA